MSSLDAFRDHCRSMATPGAHDPACLSLKPRVSPQTARWIGVEPFEPPHCDGCIGESDRTLFTRLADEVDAYLGADDSPSLFDQPATAPNTPSEEIP